MLANVIYSGISMKPLFKNADRLFYIPYSKERLQKGDVIIFNPANTSKKVVHRIISARDSIIRTKGDNNNYLDEESLYPSQIIGRVVYARRGPRKINIYRGMTGRIQCMMNKSYEFRKILFMLTRPIYNSMAKSGVVRFLRIRPQVLVFSRPSGTEIQLLVGKRVVGSKPPRGNWQIKPPFRLFLDLESTYLDGAQRDARFDQTMKR
ncbi:MAG: signal peptidase I [Methanothrix sp.]